MSRTISITERIALRNKEITVESLCNQEEIEGAREALLIERIERAGGGTAYYESVQSGNCAFPDTDPSDNFDQ
jgi:hypothetical protein